MPEQSVPTVMDLACRGVEPVIYTLSIADSKSWLVSHTNSFAPGGSLLESIEL